MENMFSSGWVSKILVKILICNFIFLILLILCKDSFSYRRKIYNYIYEDNINFSKFKNVYSKYFGGVFLFRRNIGNNDASYVFDEKISYSDRTDYYDGVKLKVLNNYLVPVIREGIVVFNGEKDRYGYVVIVEDSSGIYNWYGNICNTSLKLYDRVKKGDYIGESCQDYIYLVFSEDNVFFDYNKFID